MSDFVKVDEKKEYAEFAKKWRSSVEESGADKVIKDNTVTEKAERFLRQLELDIKKQKQLDNAFLDGFNGAY